MTNTPHAQHIATTYMIFTSPFVFPEFSSSSGPRFRSTLQSASLPPAHASKHIILKLPLPIALYKHTYVRTYLEYIHVLHISQRFHQITLYIHVCTQCLQHTVSLIHNFNPNFSTFGVYIRILCFVLYKIAANTHASLAIFSVFSILFSVLAAIIA